MCSKNTKWFLYSVSVARQHSTFDFRNHVIALKCWTIKKDQIYEWSKSNIRVESLMIKEKSVLQYIGNCWDILEFGNKDFCLIISDSRYGLTCAFSSLLENIFISETFFKSFKLIFTRNEGKTSWRIKIDDCFSK